MSSPSRGLFGRDRELAEADVALATAAAGTPQALLVGGDAGIGKTSLVSALVATARDRGFTVTTGHCLDIDTGASLGPFREAFVSLLAGLPNDQQQPVTRRLASFLTTNEAVEGTANLLVDLQLAFGEIAHQAPLVLVLEDMHWADRSTQDLAVAMARTMRESLLLVLTYRTDELTRRHPFRKALVDIARGVGSHRLELEPLDRAGISGLVEEVTGTADAALVGSLLARSEGNPLYAEELLAGDRSGVPATLSDLLLARVDALSSETRDLLRLASVGGSRIDLALVGHAAHLEEETAESWLREAIDANVVTATGERLDFRHGLLREAVYDDLMPGQRARMHAELAAAVQEQVVGAAAPSAAELGLLAHHWYEAHELSQALAASVRAGATAEGFGTPEALAHLERALDLWDQVPDPQTAGGIAKPDLLRLLARFTTAEPKSDRSLWFIREAIRLLAPESEPLLASRVYSTYAEMCNELSDELGHLEAATRALELAEGPASLELATALRMRAWLFVRGGDAAAALEHARRAERVAHEAGVPSQEAGAVFLTGLVLVETGHCRVGLERIRQAMEIARSAGLVWHVCLFQAELAWWLMVVGDTGAGIEAAVLGRERALAAGLPVEAGLNGEQVVDAWRRQGRLDEADLLLEELREGGMEEVRWHQMRSYQLVARGDFVAALPLELETMQQLRSRAAPSDGFDVLRQVELFCALGEVARAVEIAAHHLEATSQHDSVVSQAMTARAAYTALTAAAEGVVDVPVGLAERSADVLQAALPGVMNGELSHGLAAGDVLLARAMATTLNGEPAVADWRTAEAVATRIGAHYALRPRLGLVEALLASGERDEARVLLIETWQAAHDISARQFEQQASRLARRNRIPLPEEAALPRQLAALTNREREVLDVLATGATNRAIAERLFISEKTVSVHVTNVLAKLGVPNRGEAAALARELAGAD